MTKPEISDEAVEAAGKAILANAEVIQTLEYATDIARWAIEAAAPHLMAEAWDEGEHAGYLNRGAEAFGLRRPNPYRKGD